MPLALQIVWARLRIRPQWTLTDLADRLDEGRRLDELRVGVATTPHESSGES
jgi:hypothetical protein